MYRKNFAWGCILSLLFFGFGFNKVSVAQSVGIGTDFPDADAMFEVKTVEKGVLLPRMSTIQRNLNLGSLGAAQKGMLIFNTNTNAFNFWDGTQWQEMPQWTRNTTSGYLYHNILTDNVGIGLNNPAARLHVDGGAIPFIVEVSGTERLRWNTNRLEMVNTGNSVFIGDGTGAADDLTFNNNVAVGYQALQANTTGFNNLAIGYRPLYLHTNGFNNIAIGYESMRATTTGSTNIAIGHRAMSAGATSGNSNIAIGPQAMNNATGGANNIAVGERTINVNTTGYSNVAIGRETLYNNSTGYNNVAVGQNALFSNQDGSTNTAVGFQSMLQNTSGDHNTALGDNSLGFNTSGSYNSAVGHRSLSRNTTGTGNSGIGNTSLQSNQTGSYNTALGNGAMYNTNGGNNNVAVGSLAMTNNTTGSYNTSIGYYSQYTGNYTNATSVGSQAQALANNSVRIGNNTVTSIGGFTFWSNFSDGRFKRNVVNSEIGLDFIMELRPVSYQLDIDAISDLYQLPDSVRFKEAEKEKAAIVETGFIAQEVEAAVRKTGYPFSGVDAPKSDGDHYGLRYAAFVVPLVKATQEQQAVIQELTTENARLMTMMEEILQKLETLERSCHNCK